MIHYFQRNQHFLNKIMVSLLLIPNIIQQESILRIFRIAIWLMPKEISDT